MQEYQVTNPCSLLLFSDGLYEIEVEDGLVMAVGDFIDLLQRGGAAPAIDLDGILDEVRRLANGAAFSDDVSVLRLGHGPTWGGRQTMCHPPRVPRP